MHQLSILVYIIGFQKFNFYIKTDIIDYDIFNRKRYRFVYLLRYALVIIFLVIVYSVIKDRYSGDYIHL